MKGNVPAFLKSLSISPIRAFGNVQLCMRLLLFFSPPQSDVSWVQVECIPGGGPWRHFIDYACSQLWTVRATLGERVSDHPCSPLLGCRGDLHNGKQKRRCLSSLWVALETAGGEPAFPSLMGPSICGWFSPRSLLLFMPLKETLKKLTLFVKNKSDIFVRASGFKILTDNVWFW